MRPRMRRIMDRIPAWLVLAVCMSALTPIVWWAIRPLPKSPQFVVEIGDVQPNVNSASQSDEIAIPPAALTVTLRDALFDEPPAPAAPPPPPPTLDLELIAITGNDDHRVAFVHSRQVGEFLELKTGDITSQGAEVIEVGQTHILCVLGEREIRLELAP